MKINMMLPEDAKRLTVYYSKVAELEDTEYTLEDVTYEYQQKAENGGAVVLDNLEEGIYQIVVSGDSEYEFMSSLVSIPSWNEEEKQMEYEVTVIPKYNHNIPAPQTGDKSSMFLYAAFLLISVIIVVIISCHNRFKCGRMTE